MTISDLSSLTNLTSESCILVRKGGVDYQYTISQLVDELLVNPSADVSVSPILGTKSNPYSSAFIKDLTVSGSITLPDGALDGIINNCGDDVSLIVNKTTKSIEHRVYGSTKAFSSPYFSEIPTGWPDDVEGAGDSPVYVTWNPGTDSEKKENLHWSAEYSKTIEKKVDEDTGVTVTYTFGIKNFGSEALSTTTYTCNIGVPTIFFDDRGHIVSYLWKDITELHTAAVATSILGVGPNLQDEETSTNSRYFTTIDSTGNIIAPSLVLMADTTVDLTDDKTNPLVITSNGTSIKDFLYTAGYLPDTECMIAGAPGDAYLTQYGYLLTVTGGLRVGRSTDKYDKTPDGQTKLSGSYNRYVTAINKDGTISSGCAYKCYGTGTKTDSGGNETTEEGFLTAGGNVIVIPEEGISSEEREEILFTSVGGAIKTVGSIVSKSPIMGSKVFNAVWNDLADCIPVNKEAVIEPGYCYCFDGKKYYKSTKYLEKGIIGIESDTYGMHMGSKPGVKQMDVAVSGFALAYVDKEYESGTPLTCTENGYLTEIAKQDKIEYPERIVGTYWKPEPNEEWGSSDRKVKVNGRHWIKIK